MTPHKCPVCDGTGHVERPPGVPPGQSWMSSKPQFSYPCPVCDGKGVLWEPELVRIRDDGSIVQIPEQPDCPNCGAEVEDCKTEDLMTSRDFKYTTRKSGE